MPRLEKQKPIIQRRHKLQFSGRKLMAIRTRMKISRIQLAKVLGVSRITVFHWETGVFSPRPSHLGDIARTLNVTIDSLYASE